MSNFSEQKLKYFYPFLVMTSPGSYGIKKLPTCNVLAQKLILKRFVQQSKLNQPGYSEHVLTNHCLQGLILKLTYCLDCPHPMSNHHVSVNKIGKWHKQMFKG